MKDLAVVICSYNRADRVEAAIAAADDQTARHRMELIVVDDGSEPAIDKDMVSAYGAVLVRHDTNLGLGPARNTGIAAADAPVVAFTDDDCRPHPDWAERLLATYEDLAADGRRCVGVGGLVQASASPGLLGRYYLESPPVQPLEAALGRSRSLLYRAWVYAQANVRPRRQAGRRAAFSLAGANMSFRREALQAVGGFEPAIRFGGDDEELCQRLRARFGDDCLVLAPDATVEHDYELTLADMLRRAFGYGAGNARNAARHPGWRLTVFPAPFLVLALLAVAPFNRRALWAAGAAPVVLAPRWAGLAVARRRLGPLAYAYLQLLQEAATNAGCGYACARRPKEPRWQGQ